MSLTHITNHETRALARLLEQFKESDQLKDFIRAIFKPIQTAENDNWALYTERWPNTAVGAQLDALGAIVGQPREGRTDSVYALWIQGRILINRSTGLADDTLRLLLLLAPNAEHELVEQHPAGYRVDSFALLDTDPEAVFDLLVQMKPAGVRLVFAYSASPAGDLFQYDTTGYDGPAIYAGGEGS